MPGQHIVMIGATGLVGGFVADRLRIRGDVFAALVRRSTGRPNEQVAPPEQWPALAREFGADVAISALGTTRRAAGSDAAFRAVDLELVEAFARAAHAGGARHMIAVSSVGADAASRNFYLRVKGETEAALGAIGFDRLDVLRPGLLRGTRGEGRPGERLAILASPLLNLVLRGRLDRFAAIDATAVAEAAVKLVDRSPPGVFVHHNRELRGLAAA